MLSFDITDKTIKIVSGSENGGKISISNAVTIDIEDNSIENGKISNVPGLASKIRDVLKTKNMKEKNAIVSISSDQTIFKELDIPKAKGKQFLKMVKAEMQAQLGIDDTYSISYIIVNEYKDSSDKKSTPILKILATACPYEVIDNCKLLFSQLSISLKSVMIGCNCISKIILSDMRLCMKMPLLVVQIDKNFLSMNLYDDLKLAFSRFTDVDSADYSFDSDYLTQAVNENVFRMLQFQKTRKSDLPIENVVFYGDVENIDEIINAAEQMDLNASVLNVPPQVKGCEGIDFSTYANAIGALFKRDKDIEKINLLETDTSHRGKGGGGSSASGSTIMLAGIGIIILAVGGVWFVMNMKHESMVDELTAIQNNITASQEQKELFDKLNIQEEKINKYRNDIGIAADAFKTHPSISQDYFYIIESDMINAANELGLWAQITDFSYSGYTISLNIRAAADSDPSQDLPALIVEKLLLHPEFSDVQYSGYSLSGDPTLGKTVEYSISIPLTPIVPPTEAPTEAAGETAAEAEAN
ncbi:MAG: pilus assembly protein PilM [Clostridium sp.]|nr:pilus assembly protein PilM [Clostridium sp.]MCM1547081.1 pilus assembly protein PilM [Ruminococcus sp.]